MGGGHLHADLIAFAWAEALSWGQQLILAPSFTGAPRPRPRCPLGRTSPPAQERGAPRVVCDSLGSGHLLSQGHPSPGSFQPPSTPEAGPLGWSGRCPQLLAGPHL